MKKELKNYRIVSECGKTVVISRERFHCLLQTLEALANDGNSNPSSPVTKRSSMMGQ